MSNNKITIGILGGIGPEATGNFYLKLIAEMQKQHMIKSNADFPRIVINSIPAPELTSLKITSKQLKPYIDGVKALEQYGADFIVMACNTIHLYHGLLQKEVGIPILNLKDAVKAVLESNGSKSVSIFGTPATIESGLYDFKDISYLNPKGDDLELLSRTIEDFNKGKQRSKQIADIDRLAHKYVKESSGVIILACTEISLMLKGSKVSRIDTLDILAEATVKYLREVIN